MIDLDQILDELEAEESLSQSEINDITTTSNRTTNLSPEDSLISNVMNLSSNENKQQEIIDDNREENNIQGETFSASSREDSSVKQISHHKKSSPFKSSSHNLLSDILTIDENFRSYDSPSPATSTSLKTPLHNENNGKVEKEKERKDDEENKQQLPCDDITVTVCDSDGDELLRKVLEDVDEYEKYNLNSTDDLNFNLPDSEINVTGDDLEAELNAIINLVSLSSSNFTSNTSNVLPGSSFSNSSSSSTNGKQERADDLNAFKSQFDDDYKSDGNNEFGNGDVSLDEDVNVLSSRLRVSNCFLFGLFVTVFITILSHDSICRLILFIFFLIFLPIC